ncbi:MAG: endonuclease/exonuclease/phosphatase family protein [Carboxylicivirga sp.]|jgi:endonuclease/exonuclease/phosphatase family metal-dependent hydrolase|nr:endonuclease/exonuclease/phosphatase family protein [Carboxylicivirga sp.]
MKKSISTILFLAFYFITLAQTPHEKTIVKVLSFNILHGATTQNTFDLDAIAKVIINANPDFVALQEVDFKTQRAQKYDLATELGWRSKLIPLFGRAMYYDGGEYGVGILSKHSIVSSFNHALPYQKGDEPRAALSIKTVLPSKDTIVFMATHLDHKEEEATRLMQAKEIVRISKTIKHPAIFAGDLNDIPGSAPINTIESFWNASYDKINPAPTYPSDKPSIKIDYIMNGPANRWKVINKKVIANTFTSDHCAYLVTFELLPESVD